MKYDLINRQRLVQECETLLGRQPLDAATTKRLLEQAGDLGSLAYEKGDRIAEAEAERLLYLIHARNHFTAPMQPYASLIWSQLLPRKMKRDLKDHVGKEELSAREMEDLMAAALMETEQEVHPLIDRCGDEQGLRPLAVYTKNWYSSTHGFTNQLVSLLSRADYSDSFDKSAESDVKHVVLSDLTDEFDVNSPHAELRARWPKAIGLDYRPETVVSDPDQMTEAISLQNYRTGLACINDSLYALGSFFTIESVFVGVCQKLYKVGKAKGFTDHDLELFKGHAEIDPIHSAEWLRVIKESNLTARQRVKVANGALCQLELRRRMFEAMDDYLFQGTTIPRRTVQKAQKQQNRKAA